MRITLSVLMAVVGILLSLALFVVGAVAQTEVVKNVIAKAEAAMVMVDAACADDFGKYCSTVTPGEGRLALCLMAHEDKISDTCYATFLDVADGVELAISNVWRAADDCEKDMEKVCATVTPGEGRIAQCLIDNKASVSPACRAEVAVFEARIRN